MSSFCLRAVTKHDAQALQRVQRLVDEFDGESFIDLASIHNSAPAREEDMFRTLAAELDQSDEFIAQVAYLTDEPDQNIWIGLAITKLHIDQTAEVLSLWVDREHRGSRHPEQRVADTLLAHAFQAAKDLGAKRAEGFVNPSSKHTLAFLARHRVTHTPKVDEDYVRVRRPL